MQLEKNLKFINFRIPLILIDKIEKFYQLIFLISS
jgi:hypothetical protein